MDGICSYTLMVKGITKGQMNGPNIVQYPFLTGDSTYLWVVYKSHFTERSLTLVKKSKKVNGVSIEDCVISHPTIEKINYKHQGDGSI